MQATFYRMEISVEAFDRNWTPSGSKGKRIVFGVIGQDGPNEAEISYRARKVSTEAVRDMEASRPIEGQQ